MTVVEASELNTRRGLRFFSYWIRSGISRKRNQIFRLHEIEHRISPKDYHWRCQNEEISHLCFADDLMVFSNGDLESIAIINNVLHIFQHLSGLTPNPAKSEVFILIILVKETTKNQITNMLGYKEGKLPVRSLGVPQLTTKLKASDCKVLVDRKPSKLQHWTGRSLSYAGRLQLRNSILFSMQVYWAGFLILPGKVVKQQNK